MISLRELKKQYNKLLEDVKTEEFYTKIDLSNRLNCYVCKCGHITKTKDVDAGVTPFIHTCEKCGFIARSSFYQDIAPNQEPTQEWYRPTFEELSNDRKDDDYISYILQGGLTFKTI
jgi:hypothetical protein